MCAGLRRRASRVWHQHWQGRPPSWPLLIAALLTAGLLTFPILNVLEAALQGSLQHWGRLLTTRIPQLVWNTASLTAAVTLAAGTAGTALAVLVIRTDLPGRQFWRWVLAVPLVIPPYLGALGYILFLGPRGVLTRLLGVEVFPVFSFWGTVLVLTLFTYPYMFLIASAALQRINQHYEEAAFTLGLNSRQALRRVVLPLIRPAMGAGAILIALYVLSDFGAVALLRYETFTRAIYYQMTGRFDHTGAAILSVLLIAGTFAVLSLERLSRSNQSFYQTAGVFRQPKTIPLGRLKPWALVFTTLVFALSLLVPLGALAYWSLVSIEQGALDSRFWGFSANSLIAAGGAAVICTLFALPLSYLKSRFPSLTTRALLRLAYMGYALPGVIAALGVLVVFERYIPILYGSIFVLITAYTIRFLPQSLQAQDAALELVPPRMDEAARILGQTHGALLWRVILPQILPSVLAGGALVFVSALKELPATLLLRPAGFDTLAVRIWMESVEGFYGYAAPAGLLLILVSVVPLKLILQQY